MVLPNVGVDGFIGEDGTGVVGQGHGRGFSCIVFYHGCGGLRGLRKSWRRKSYREPGLFDTMVESPEPFDGGRDGVLHACFGGQKSVYPPLREDASAWVAPPA